MDNGILGGNGAQATNGAPATNGAQVTNDFIVDGSDNTFAQQVLQESTKRPVIVDFWAPWCGPCKALTPILEKAVTQLKGQVMLVKINIDVDQMVASHMQVKSIPLVIGFLGGKPLDAMAGAQSEKAVNDFLKALISAAQKAGIAGNADQAEKIEALLERAQEFLDSADAPSARVLYEQALSQGSGQSSGPEADQTSDQNSALVPALAGLARCYLLAGEADQADGLLLGLDEAALQDKEVLALKAAIAFRREFAALKVPKPSNKPQSPQDFYNLALGHFAADEEQAGLEQLFASLERDAHWDEDAARKLLVRWMDTQGTRSRKVPETRRRLAKILFK